MIIASLLDLPFFFLKQGSTLRKRKMYEEFLSKVSILGEFGKLYEELINWRICDTWHSFIHDISLQAHLYVFSYMFLFAFAKHEHV